MFKHFTLFTNHVKHQKIMWNINDDLKWTKNCSNNIPTILMTKCKKKKKSINLVFRSHSLHSIGFAFLFNDDNVDDDDWPNLLTGKLRWNKKAFHFERGGSCIEIEIVLASCYLLYRSRQIYNTIHYCIYGKPQSIHSPSPVNFACFLISYKKNEQASNIMQN